MSGQPFVCRQQLLSAAIQLQGRTAVQPPVVSRVPFQERLIAQPFGIVQRPSAGSDVFPAFQHRVFIPAVEAGAYIEQYRSAVGVRYRQAAARAVHPPSLGQYAEARVISHTLMGVVPGIHHMILYKMVSVFPFAAGAIARKRYLPLPDGDRCVEGRRKAHLKADPSRAVACHPDRHHLVRFAHEHFPLIFRGARLVFHAMNAAGHIKRPAIACHIALLAHFQVHVAQRQVHLGPERREFLLDQLLRLCVFPLLYQSLRFPIGGLRFGIAVILRVTAPKSILVERYAL